MTKPTPNRSLLVRTAGLSACALLVGCAAGTSAGGDPTTPSGSSVATQSDNARATPKPLYALSYVAGPAWKKGRPPQEQDLAAHFAYVDRLFKDGVLVVNGLFGDEVRGLYVFAAG